MMCVAKPTVPERAAVPPVLVNDTVTCSHQRSAAAVRVGAPTLSFAAVAGAGGGAGLLPPPVPGLVGVPVPEPPPVPDPVPGPGLVVDPGVPLPLVGGIAPGVVPGRLSEPPGVSVVAPPGAEPPGGSDPGVPVDVLLEDAVDPGVAAWEGLELHPALRRDVLARAPLGDRGRRAHGHVAFARRAAAAGEGGGGSRAAQGEEGG